MNASLRPILDAELGAFVLALGYGFGDRWSLADHPQWASAELDRTVGAFVDGEMVATGRNYSVELTLPGDVVVPAGGVSWITTRPTHRRGGLLTRVMAYLINESRDRGEAVSILGASEGGIYPRFGYGVAARMAKIAVDRSAALVVAPSGLSTPGTVRLLEADHAVQVASPLFDRVRRTRVGAVSRPVAWWAEEWAASDWIDARRRFDVVYEEDGQVEGYAMYALDGDWSDGVSKKVVAVRDFIAASPKAEAALWQYLFNIDLTVEVVSWNTPLDSPLPWLLSDSRQYRTQGIRDSRFALGTTDRYPRSPHVAVLRRGRNLGPRGHRSVSGSRGDRRPIPGELRE